jgi:cellulose synthase/poly-beta-1,6-N-acetylglucosamine synthase-like glycosyltransferase
MRPREDRGGLLALSGFAFLVRNLVRQRGLARLGAPALLTGAGMAVPWKPFAKAPLDSGDLAEDLTLGISLAESGCAPAFLADAVTWSEPAGRSATFDQRVRWEHGFLGAAFRRAPPLLAAGSWPLAWLGLHLLVPPLSLLFALDALALALLGWLTSNGSAMPPLLTLAAIVMLMLGGLAVSWARFGREQISAGELLQAPIYILWKLPIYALAILKPQRQWIRTARDPGEKADT